MNGVGKTTVLDTLAVCLSAVIKEANSLRASANAFSVDDVRLGADALSVECTVAIGPADHSYLVHRPREGSVARVAGAGQPREQVHSTPTHADFSGARPAAASDATPGGRPLAVFFGARRSLVSERSASASGAPR